MKVSLKSLVYLFCAVSWATSCAIAGEVEKEKVSQKEEATNTLDPIVLTLPNGTKMEFMPIPAGKFVMGSPKNEAGRNKDENQVQVNITKAFYMGKTEVTQAQYSEMIVREMLAAADRLEFEKAARLRRQIALLKKSKNKPVTEVSWFGATTFCKRLTAWAHEQGKMRGWKFTLPTEAQWEYACRAGTTTTYHSGDKIRDLKRVAYYSGTEGANPVAQKEPNAFGLYDMHGNVWEWCLDWYGSRLQGGDNPTGPKSGSRRVNRGGSWFNGAQRCRSALRDYNSPGFQIFNLGFRVALVRE